MRNHLIAAIDEIEPAKTQRIDDHDRPAISFRHRCRAAGKTGIGGLHDDHDTSLMAGLQGPPHFHQCAGPNHREGCASPVTIALPETPRLGIARQAMPLSHGIAQFFKKIIHPFRASPQLGAWP